MDCQVIDSGQLAAKSEGDLSLSASEMTMVIDLRVKMSKNDSVREVCATPNRNTLYGMF